MKNKIYIAGGWFTPNQVKHLDILDKKLENQNKYDYFRPRTDCLGIDGISDWNTIYTRNIEELELCDYMIAITTDKDMGTLVEVGQFIEKNKPIIFFTPGLTGKFNLMLAKPAHRVCTTIEELDDALLDLSIKREYTDGIE